MASVSHIQSASWRELCHDFHFLFQELNVKLTKLGKQLQANQIMLHEIKATLLQNGLEKSNASRLTDGNSAA